MTIGKAEVRRVLKLDGVLCAEVEVATGDRQGRTMLARICRGDEQDFVLRQVVHNDADYTADWYDNNLHQAYAAVEASHIEEEVGMSGKQFLQTILADPSVRVELNRLI
ncbi:hypothetical protein IDH44_05595 [Paenibacillus sp. IB182496]|uniref:Uncharacterized protein n=1 Tax=Paenibacillus sabuli TaxID=2772509 RepID=A0A927BRY7_9BACL|nr:hypothetical protein [Paenibacillus sabuli]MBD2844655.1 hypothetical protein [Paenibacillus sabuli]